jgi:hypothetical protein
MNDSSENMARVGNNFSFQRNLSSVSFKKCLTHSYENKINQKMLQQKKKKKEKKEQNKQNYKDNIPCKM